MTQPFERERKSFREIATDQRVILFAVLLLMGFVVTMLNSRFIKLNNIILIFQQISVVGTITMCMSLLMLGGEVDLSVGSIMVLSGCTMAVLIVGNGKGIEGGMAPWLAVVIGLLMGLLCGVLNGIITAKSKCPSLIITLGLSSVYYGVSLILTNGRVMSFKRAFDNINDMRFFGVVPLTLVIFLLLVVVMYFIVNRTKFGRRVVAIGGNAENARLCGIDVDLDKILTFAITGLYCGIGAIIYSSRLDSMSSGSGSGYETSALTGAIIGGVTFTGGKGSITGAFLGALFMGVLSNAMDVLAVQTYTQTVIKGVIIVAAIVISNLNNLRRK
ncbi:ABC transporter permease [bacterium]|nr:ABC transporter permease [bacterium]